MAGPFESFKNNNHNSTPQIRVSKGAVVRTFSLQVMINCTCGATDPILIHMIPNANFKFICPTCRAEFKVGKFLFDIQNGNNVQVAVAMIPPDVVVPARS